MTNHLRMTEYLEIDLERETWRCTRCAHEHGSARENYKHGLLVCQRDPAEIHDHLAHRLIAFRWIFLQRLLHNHSQSRWKLRRERVWS